MDYQQLKQPDLNVVGIDGYCLKYVTEVFGVPEKYDTATEAWNNAQYQHIGNPPNNIAVPVWFSWTGTEGGVTQDWGHVCVWDKGTIYSTAPGGDRTYSSIEEVINTIGGNSSYRGWSEDINSVRVVQEEQMETWNNGDTYNLLYQISPSVANEAKAANYVGYFGAQNGMDFKTAFYDIIQSEQYGLIVQAAQSQSLSKTNVEAYIGSHLS